MAGEIFGNAFHRQATEDQMRHQLSDIERLKRLNIEAKKRSSQFTMSFRNDVAVWLLDNLSSVKHGNHYV
jgi:hypothetical protein